MLERALIAYTVVPVLPQKVEKKKQNILIHMRSWAVLCPSLICSSSMPQPCSCVKTLPLLLVRCFRWVSIASRYMESLRCCRELHVQTMFPVSEGTVKIMHFYEKIASQSIPVPLTEINTTREQMQCRVTHFSGLNSENLFNQIMIIIITETIFNFAFVRLWAFTKALTCQGKPT